MTDKERRLRYFIQLAEVDWKLRAVLGFLLGLSFGVNGVMLGLFLSTIGAALIREFWLKPALADLERTPPVAPGTGPAVPDSEIRDQAQAVPPLAPDAPVAPVAPEPLPTVAQLGSYGEPVSPELPEDEDEDDDDDELLAS